MGQQSNEQDDITEHYSKKGELFMKNIKKITAIILVCTLTLSAILPVFAATPSASKVQAQKVSEELLELMSVSYSDLNTNNFVDDGTTYSCIIWINDIDKEIAVRAGIDAAEKTRDTYRASAKYDYPYTIEEVNGTKYVEVQLADNENDEYVQTYIEAERNAAAELYETSNANFVAENFKTRNAEVNYISSYTPCIFADLTISRIIELIQQEDVNEIEYWNSSLDEELADSNNVDYFSTQNLTTLNEYIRRVNAVGAQTQYGVSGSGIKIGMYERGYTSDMSVIKKPGDVETRPHATNVFTIMDKVAPDATYYAAGQERAAFLPDNEEYQEILLQQYFTQGIEWLIDQGVNIINMSQSLNGQRNTYNANARWIDYLVYNHNIHFVIGAGNGGSAGIEPPAMAYNAIAVGNTKRESPYGRYNTSSYNSGSVSINSHCTYKPDLSAPGCYGTPGGNGTSYAAPLVTGTIALMCDYYPTLKTRPHIVKAMLAASTSATYGRYYNGGAGFVQLGAGVIDAKAAIQIAANSHYSGAPVNSSSPQVTYNMSVTTNSVKRVALTYNKTITSDSSNVTIAALKLEILDTNNTVVASCTNSAANLKVVQFTPQTTGTYKIRITQTSSNSVNTSTIFGVAWQ